MLFTRRWDRKLSTWWVETGLGLERGLTLVLLQYKWDPLHAIELIQAEKVTGMVGVPSMHIQVLEHQDVAKYDLSSLLTFSSGGAPAPVSFSKQVKEKFATKQGANGWGE